MNMGRPVGVCTTSIRNGRSKVSRSGGGPSGRQERAGSAQGFFDGGFDFSGCFCHRDFARVFWIGFSAWFELDHALFESAVTDCDAERQTDEIGVFEFYTGSLVSIIDESFDARLCKLRLDFVDCSCNLFTGTDLSDVHRVGSGLDGPNNA